MATAVAEAKTETKKTKPYVLFNLLCILFIANSVFLATFYELSPFYHGATIPEMKGVLTCEGSTRIGYTMVGGWNDATEILSCIVSLLLGTTIIFLAHKKLGAKPNFFLISVFGVLILGAFLSYFGLMNTTDVPWSCGEVFTFSLADHWRLGAIGVNAMWTSFMIFAYIPYGKFGRGGWWIIAEGFVIAMLLPVLFSIVKEWDKYIYILKNRVLDDAHAPTSWLSHKNVYGRYLLIGLTAELYMLFLDRRRWRYITVVVFLGSLLLSMAKTPFLIGLVMTMAFLIFMGVLDWKKKRVHAYIELGVVALGVLAVLAFVALPESALGPLKGLSSSIKQSLMGDGGSMTTRREIWMKSFRLFQRESGFNRFFGFGDQSFAAMAGPMMDSGTRYVGLTHNAWIEMLMRGGILRVVCGAILTGYLVRKIVLGMFHKENSAYVSAIFFAGLLFHGAFESVSILDSGLESTMLTLITIIPILGVKGDEVVPVPQEKATKEDWAKGLRALALLLTPVFMAVCLIPGNWAIRIGGILAATLAQFVLLYYYEEDKKNLIIKIVLFGSLDLLTIALFLFFPFTAGIDYALMAIWAFSITAISYCAVLFLLPEKARVSDPLPFEALRARFVNSQIKE